MCLRPCITVKKENDRPVGYQVFPCGSCPECIKAKQNAYLQKLVLASRQYSSLWFLTNTFSNKTVPLLWKPLKYSELEKYYPPPRDALLCEINRLQGDFYKEFDSGRLITDDFYYDKMIRDQWIQNCPVVHRKVKGRVIECQVNEPLNLLCYHSSDDQELNLRSTVTATLDNRSVQLWIKQFRKRFSEADFRYFCCGEYGSLAKRPHYHILIFGLSRHEVDQLAQLWKVRYGRCDVSEVEKTPLNGEDHSSFVSRYVSKYIVKGSYDVDLLQNGFVRRPRVMSSSNLYQMSQREADWYSGKDLGYTLDSYDLSDAELDRLIARQKIRIGKYDYGLAPLVKNQLFKRKTFVYDENSQKFKVSVKATPLQSAMSNRLQELAVERTLQEFGVVTGTSLEEASDSALESFKDSQSICTLERARVILKQQKDVYRKSKF